MRDPNRIDEFTSELNRIWKKYYSDWRFGQFMCNLLGEYCSETKKDPFFTEEKDMLEFLYKFCEEK